MCNRGRMIVMGLTLLLPAGCSVVSEGEAWRAATYPPDFRLEFEVIAPAADDGAAQAERDLARTPQRYVVEADRTLRASVGTTDADPTYPPVTARISPEAMRRLWTLSQATLREGASNDDDRGGPTGVQYHWSVWADHHVTRRGGTPDRAPAASRLRAELARLAAIPRHADR